MRKRLGRGPFDYSNMVRSNDTWPDHRARALVTGALIAWLEQDTVIDPACGDGSIVLHANRLRSLSEVRLNDISVPTIDSIRFAPLPDWTYSSGTIEGLLDPELGQQFDVIVLTEILEHLEDPDLILRLAALKARFLVASSPEMRKGQTDTNAEHLWQFDKRGYEKMLTDNGWRTFQYTHLGFPATEYDFQIWLAERAA